MIHRELKGPKPTPVLLKENMNESLMFEAKEPQNSPIYIPKPAPLKGKKQLNRQY